MTVQQFLPTKVISWALDDLWRVFVGESQALVLKAKNVFTELQGLRTLVSRQRECLQALVIIYCAMSLMEGPVGDNRLQEKDPSTHSLRCSFVMSNFHARPCLECLGRWMLQALERMDEASQVLTVRRSADVLVKPADGIFKIVSERDSLNDVKEQRPAVLPHQLVKSDMRASVSNIGVHEKRVLCFFQKLKSTRSMLNSAPCYVRIV